jgi:hypothetical protein
MLNWPVKQLQYLLIVILFTPFVCFGQDSRERFFIPQESNGRSVYYLEMIEIAPYTVYIGDTAQPKDCENAKQSFLKKFHDAGDPSGPQSSGLTHSDMMTKAALFSSYSNAEACNLGIEEIFDSDPSGLARFMSWILSNQHALVTLDQNHLLRNMGTKGLRQSKLPLTADDSSRPHSDVISPQGLIIGTIFAEDPPATYENGEPVYDVKDDGPKFIRHFKSLFPGSLTKPLDFDLEVSADPKQSLDFHDGPVRTVIRAGQMQTAEWDIYPLLARNAFEDKEADITLHGTISQFPDETRVKASNSFGIDIPNNHFKIRRRSVASLLTEHIKEFFTSVPGWVSLIEAAALAVVGLLNLKWLKRKKARTRRRRPASPAATGQTPGASLA